ncbi:TolB family protein [Sideroxydans lithotrophicus]|nr:PD40 domain-containing protein [Sideroxydans lithotrophicus]
MKKLNAMRTTLVSAVSDSNDQIKQEVEGGGMVSMREQQVMNNVDVKSISKFRGLCHAIAIVVLLFQPKSFAADVVLGATEATNNRERLLAKNVTYTEAVWCGNNALVLDVGESGSFLFELPNGARRKVSNSGYIGATSCSIDGKWLIIVDTRTARADRDASGHVDYAHSVQDYSRIDLVSGKKERFAIAQGGGVLSPDGSKILFLGKAPQLSIKQTTTKWEFYWSHDWPSGTGGVAAWMPDSKTLFLGHRGKFFLQRGQDLTTLDVMSPQNFPAIVQIKIDSQEHIYVSTTDTKTLAMMYQLFKCSINLTQINCIKIAGSSAGVITFDVSQDGHQLVYVNPDHSELYSVDIATQKTKRLAEKVEGYPSISPDGGNVVFYRLRAGNTEGVGQSVDDAYIMPLK